MKDTKQKLELKHLLPYLPYELEYYPSENSDLYFDIYADYPTGFLYSQALEFKEPQAVELSKSTIKQKEVFIAYEDDELFLGQCENSLGFDMDDVFLSEVKPILKPLSGIVDDWDRLMDEYGDFDHHCQVWDEWHEHIVSFQDKLHEANIESCPYGVAQILFQEHYDLFGLIEKGLAIDKNKIK